MQELFDLECKDELTVEETIDLINALNGNVMWRDEEIESLLEE